VSINEQQSDLNFRYSWDDLHPANMRQCILEKCSGNGSLRLTAWLPLKFAVKGKVVRLRDKDGNWSDGWMVKETFACASAAGS